MSFQLISFNKNYRAEKPDSGPVIAFSKMLEITKDTSLPFLEADNAHLKL